MRWSALRILRRIGASAFAQHITTLSSLEGFFGRLKNEFFYGRNWQGVSPQEFSMMLDAYLVYYNERRLKESLGWLSPMQFRRSLGLAD